MCSLGEIADTIARCLACLAHACLHVRLQSEGDILQSEQMELLKRIEDCYRSVQGNRSGNLKVTWTDLSLSLPKQLRTLADFIEGKDDNADITI
jgi:hypothetical protein